MEFKTVTEQQWPKIKEIYMEAFPKRERKPYFTLRHSVKKKKAVVMTAMEKEQLLGFTSSDIFIEGASGKMEILNYGGKVSQEDYISLQKHALGAIFFKLSGIKIVKSKTV